MMYLRHQAVLATLLFSVLAVGYPEGRDHIAEHCYTSFATTRHWPVPTISETHIVKHTATRTEYFHKTVTVTPRAVTSTVTHRKTITDTTTEPTPTDTATITDATAITDTQTADTTTITTTSTSTETDTTTTTSTTTIAAVSGFVPIETTLPGSMYKRKRDEYTASARVRRSLKSTSIGLCKGPAPPRYPKKVICDIIDNKTTTKTVSKTETCTRTTRTPTVTITHTNTLTTTSTVYPNDVSTTVTTTQTDYTTITTTPSTTSTATTTTTTTDTVQAAPTTYYSQCASANFASTGPNGPLFALDDSSGSITSTTDNSYDCCVACDWGAFILGTDSDNCALFTQATCTSASEYQWEINEMNSGRPLFEYFNGNCGQVSSYES
ncbi:hypothetical protein OIDMADRAFT_56646 [Oidiodendron maius Zn]|uniref:Apple domain-containing protein n=1 Tax=Oidiodendron maius (strain Zn) TaxID=913774 RepID=A0A0C3CH24_OIDMZ|nr:hypothetical protein OIDMADRAFT_56646 [Oidiodendron maius Zn]